MNTADMAPPAALPETVADPRAFVQQDGETRRLTLLVRGARCGGCLAKIETAARALPGITAARLNLSSGRLEISGTPAMDAAKVTRAIAELGYGVQPLDEDRAGNPGQEEERALLIAMGVAAFATANIMLLSVSVWGGFGEMGEATRQALHAVSGLIALPTVLYSGQPFFRSAFSVLRRGRTNMDVPISLALILAFSVSAAETLAGGRHAYFDAVVMLLFFLLIGRFLDARVRRRAYSAARDLAALANRSVTRLSESGRAETVRASAIQPGDRILLAPGERAVIDMTILDGASELDESLVTGETHPRAAAEGMSVLAGAVNLTRPLTGRAIAAAGDSRLADIGRMLEAGEQRRSAYRQIADKAVSLYVPLVHATALITFLGWYLAGAGLREAILIAVSTLIITCPCALALAAPVTQVVAAGRLFRIGAYLRSGDGLERLATADHIVFDKTGTLTLGAPALGSSLPREVLMDAACLARASRHPLSRAIAGAAGPGPIAEALREVAGQGLEGRIDGRLCRLGSAEWTGAKAAAGSGATLYFACEGTPPVPLRFEDRLRDEAGEAVRQLRDMGLSAEILSGDTADKVAGAAARLGLSDWTAAASPRDKAARLETLRAEGRHVLMIGDGLNDAGALALAHASLAPGGAIDISQSASDAVYSGGLETVPRIIALARAARSVMIQNFTFAALYNLVAVPIAVTGHASPLVAAIAMSASSIIVCLNALRLNASERGAI